MNRVIISSMKRYWQKELINHCFGQTSLEPFIFNYITNHFAIFSAPANKRFHPYIFHSGKLLCLPSRSGPGWELFICESS